MRLSRYAVELLFGIGFKMGFLITLMGGLMMYMPVIERAVNPLLGMVGFWDAFNSNPQWVRVFMTGFALMGVAAFVTLIKGWIEPLIDTLFFEDQGSKVK
jgi:hypothetical protein